MKGSIKKLLCAMTAFIFVFCAGCNMQAMGGGADKSVVTSYGEHSGDADDNKSVGGETEKQQEPMKGVTDLMAGFTPAYASPVKLAGEYGEAYNELTAKLIKKLYAGDNLLISPLSIQLALSMTALGAAGRTLEEMEALLFNGGTSEAFGRYAREYINSLTGAEDVRLSVADSVWIREDMRENILKDFLQANADYYGADAYAAPFDEDTKDAINGWINDKTNGMIEKMLDDIDKDSLMYLINAFYFEAEWRKKFEPAFKDEFKNIEGVKTEIDMMSDYLESFLSDDVAVGFKKYYQGGRFAFCAMLPNDNVSLADMIASLTGERLKAFFDSEVKEGTMIRMPKFKDGYEKELKEPLSELGMPTAFGDGANFSKMVEKVSVCISKVRHKTAIDVNENGTNAAAVTIVEMKENAAYHEYKHKVYLNRPFMYFILDTTTGMPLFVGTMTK